MNIRVVLKRFKKVLKRRIASKEKVRTRKTC